MSINTPTPREQHTKQARNIMARRNAAEAREAVKEAKEAPVDPVDNSLEHLTKGELKKICEERGLTYAKKMTNAQLVQLIKEA